MKRTLSEREITCLIQYGRGMRVTDISKEMRLSMKTISTYLTRAQDKLRAKTRAELLEFAKALVEPAVVSSHIEKYAMSSTDAMFHPFEVLDNNTRQRRTDLPDFKTSEEVGFYLANNNSVSWRDGKFVRLEWVECHDEECAKSHGK